MHETLISRFIKMVNTFPSDTAITDGDFQFSYQELYSAVLRVASDLKAQGISTEESVAIFSGRHVEFIAGALGIMLAGGAYTPISPDYPKESMEALFRSSNIRFLLGTSDELKFLDNLSTIEITLKGDNSTLIEPTATSNGVAYQLFTSGSTGSRKLVAIEHSSVCALLDGFDQIAPHRGRIISTTVCPFDFDVSIWEIFSALTKGGCVHILTNDKVKNPSLLAQYLLDNQITNVYIPPAVLHHTINEFCKVGNIGHLQRFLVGVEPIPQQVLQKLRDLSPDIHIINGYGPTETTICATFYPFKNADSFERRTPIGWPVPGWIVEVVDDKFTPVPVGLPGQIIISGKGVARGYSNNMSETDKRFVNLRGERWFLTGDMGQVLPSGAIEFLGREDDQVKVRGFRIELGEVEAALLKHPLVQSSIVLAPKSIHGRRLIAFAMTDISSRQLESHLAEQLPNYMLPSRVVTMPVFPTTLNGKIDRGELMKILESRPPNMTFKAPRTDLEKRWAEIWSEVLGIRPIGIEDNFFELGGDSILALVIADRMAEACACPELSSLFLQHSTIQAAASMYDSVTISKEAKRYEVEENQKLYPLSFGQQGIWTLQHFQTHSLSFALPICFHLKGSLTSGEILNALKLLIMRHEAFRLEYSLVEKSLYQALSLELPEVLLEETELLVESVFSQVNKRFIEDAQQVIALKGTPARFRVLSVADGSKIILITIHHIAIDGTSVTNLVSDLCSIFSNDLSDTPIQGPRLFALKQKALVGSHLWKQDQAFWKNELLSLPDRLELPKSKLTKGAGRAEQILSKELSDIISTLSIRYKTTHFCIVLSIMGFVASKLSNQKEFFIATPISNRSLDSCFKNSIGYFVNLLPFRIQCRGDLDSFLDETIKHFQKARSHINFPFEVMLRDLVDQSKISQHYFTQFVVAQEMDYHLPVKSGDCEINELPIPALEPMYELTAFVKWHNGVLQLRWEYDRRVFSDQSIRDFQDLFISLVANSLSEKPTFDAPIDIFDRQVIAFPEGIALEEAVSQRKYTYAELSVLSHHIASHLISLGVRKGTPVVVLAERSPLFIATLLGIFRAGGFYIPIDSQLPFERIKFIIDSVGVKLAVGDRDLQIEGLKVVKYNEASAPLSSEYPEYSCEDLAYIMFTSGSTGVPKGVVIPARGITRLVCNQNYAEFSNRDKFGLFSNLSFDAATLEIWGALLNGGSLILPTDEMVRDPNKVASLISQTGITAGFFNVTFFRQIIKANPNALKGMHTILVGGENVPASLFVEAAKTLNYSALVNGYGPTENTTFSCCHRLNKPPVLSEPIPIGRPINHSSALIVNDAFFPVPVGEIGEILVGGAGLAKGYIANDDETKKRFLTTTDGCRWYRTGDFGRMLPSGEIEYLGRQDDQIKVQGFRIEMGEIEAAFMQQKGVNAVAVLSREIKSIKRIEAYIEGSADKFELRHQVSRILPNYMIPALIVMVEKFPMTANGKLDRTALFKLPQTKSNPSHSSIQQNLIEIFQDVLQVSSVDINDNFFDIGANSLLLVVLAEHIRQKTQYSVEVVNLLDHPTISKLSNYIGARRLSDPKKINPDAKPQATKVAIVGMAGRFPGASNIKTFWARTTAGIVDIEDTPVQKSGYINRRGILSDTDKFDAKFFGVSDREAKCMDPQQRVLLEVAQHALDDAALDPNQSPLAFSTFVACGPSEPWSASHSLSEQYEIDLANSPDFAATRLSYRLNLSGESMTVQTGCSSSLVALHLACQSLLSNKSDVAIAGGVSFPRDQTKGYIFEEGMITSPTGRCCPFDESADGTVPGGGAVAVVLMRLEDAVKDNYRIRAVIAGLAVNNDGASKLSFMAPSPSGQANVISQAHSNAGVEPGSIGYVETHGTGTDLGDAVEVDALARAFALKPICCALGSVKANYGHLDRASGITGFLRAALAVETGLIPPMASFKNPNKKLKLGRGGFTIPEKCLDWPKEHKIRRAGVSSFGVGGTNVHVILEEPPEPRQENRDKRSHLFILSAQRKEILNAQVNSLESDLSGYQDKALPSIARTLALGRPSKPFRTFFCANSIESAQERIKTLNFFESKDSSELCMIFPGQGDACVEGYRGLYEEEPVFKRALDLCAEKLLLFTGFDIRDDLYQAREVFADMSHFQPAMFAVQWALAELWDSWGVKPGILLGHSLGEVVAATRAHVFQLDNALEFVALRGRFMQETQLGAMITVMMDREWVEKRLLDNTYIAAVNSSEVVVVSGTLDAVKELEKRFLKEGVVSYPLPIYRAAHSKEMQKAASRLHKFLETIILSPPQIPILSNVTGKWADESMADPNYWSSQITKPVLFYSCLEVLTLKSKQVQFLVVGSGGALKQLIVHQLEGLSDRVTCAKVTKSERDAHLEALGQVWANGLKINFLPLLGEHLPPAIALSPTIFDHRQTWPTANASHSSSRCGAERLEDPGAWMWGAKFSNLSINNQRKSTRSILSFGTEYSIERQVFEEAIKKVTNLVSCKNISELTSVEECDILWWPSENVSIIQADFIAKLAALNVWVVTSKLGKSHLQALIRVVPLEYPGANWHLVEITCSELVQGAEKFLRLLETSHPPAMLQITNDSILALEFTHLWPHWSSRPLRPNGCYVITGGGGRVARALVSAISKEVAANFILLGRSAEIKNTISTEGSKVEYQQVDVTCVHELKTCFSNLRSRFGRIDGVIHAAGFTNTNEFKLISETNEENVGVVSAAKLKGTAAISEALNNDDADFIILCSSLSTVLGGVKFFSYIAANAELDRFAERQWEKGDCRWISVAWDAWTSSMTWQKSGPAKYALDDDDGYEVFKRLLSINKPVVIVSTGEILSRIEEVRSEITGLSNVDSLVKASITKESDQMVSDVLKDVIGELPTDPTIDLRKIGIESLTILQIATRLRNHFGIRIALVDVMRSLSLNGLQELVKKALPTSRGSNSHSIEVSRAPKALTYPTSSIQRRWIELIPKGYGGLDIVIEVEGECSLEKLAQAVNVVLNAHSGLRTCFVRTGEFWSQLIVDNSEASVKDFSHVDEAKKMELLKSLVKEKVEKWFNIVEEPPFDITVVGLSKNRNAIVIHAHHIVFDGWSSSLLLRDIAHAVSGTFVPPHYQYHDFAVSHQEFRKSSAALAYKDYWKKHFQTAPSPTRLSSDIFEQIDSDASDLLHFTINPSTMNILRARSSESGFTVFTFLLAAYSLLLSEMTGNNKLIIGTTTAGRPLPSAENIIGVFVNPFPIHIELEENDTFLSFLSRIHGTLVGLLEHNYTLEDLVKNVDPFIGYNLNDTFHCYLLYQNYIRPAKSNLSFKRMDVGSVGHHRLMREFEIVLEDSNNGGLCGELWYRTNRFSKTLMLETMSRFVDLVENLNLFIESNDKQFTSLSRHP